MLKSQRFWSKNLKDKITLANNALKTKNFTTLQEILDELIEDLQDIEVNWKDRVAICFILEQMAAIDPLVDKIVDGLMNVLQGEQDPHVKEFAVWALGKIVEESESLDLIKHTMPLIITFLNDDSEQVKSFAQDLHTRLNEFIKEKEEIDDQIQDFASQLTSLVNQKLKDMKNRGDEISREALALDYQAAFERRDEMKNKISKFTEINQINEDEILALETNLIKKFKAFKGESRKITLYWRTQRGEKEDLIRRVDCILRIQSKIYKIIQFILENKNNKLIELGDIKELTKATGRPYSEKEVIEILQELVDEEIVPNFMLDQIKDYQIKANSYLNSDSNEKKEKNDGN